jgi:uncharacterized ion transporter superfamily protein YfcC
MFKNFKIPHTFTIVFGIIIACAIATWIIPGGQFDRKNVVVDGSERSIVVTDSYHKVDHEPQTWQIFTSFFKGFNRTSGIIVFILMIGGAFWVLNYTNAINIGIFSFIKTTDKLKRFKFLNKIGVHNIIFTLIILLFSLFGAVFGMSEETIAFIVIFVPLTISMGYDSVVGVLICYVAAHVGFAGAMLNPFTIGIAQGLSGLPTFSGLEYRMICWLILTILAIVFILIYAAKVKKNPEKSFMYDLDSYWREKVNVQQNDLVRQKSTISTWIVYSFIAIILIFCSFKLPNTSITIGGETFKMAIFPILTLLFIPLGLFTLLKSVHSFILTLLLMTVLVLVVGVLGYQWYIMEIAALFFAMGIFSGFAFNLSFDTILKEFLVGCKDIMNAALIVGLAGGIIVILEDGKVVDTILYAISRSLNGTGREGALGAMYMIQNGLNLIIPSGSAKAALTIPMMAEFSDIIGIHRQLTVLAFQFGDGFTNMFTPASGVLIGVLGVAKIPYSRWAKFILPYILILIVIGFLLLLPPLYLHFNGF